MDSMEKLQKICRFCLKFQSSFSSKFSYLDEVLKSKLHIVMPELDLSISVNPCICESCSNYVNNMYSFKKGCLEIEEKIKHLQRKSRSRKVDLLDVINYFNEEVPEDIKNSRSESNFVSEYEKENQELDINDDVPAHLAWQNAINISKDSADNEINERKRRYTRDASETYLEKRQRVSSPTAKDDVPEHYEKSRLNQYLPNTQSNSISIEKNEANLYDLVDILPHFSYRFRYNKNTTESMEQWCEKVDVIKRLQNWSDETAIAVVTKKLKFIKSFEKFINQSTSWDEWKKNILQSVPDATEFTLYMRKVLNRKKIINETYVDYYHEKMKLLGERPISDERLVSCLIQGIQDRMTSVLARIRNFKTPEQLLEYFESCDERDQQLSAHNGKRNNNIIIKINAKWQKMQKCNKCGNVIHHENNCEQSSNAVEGNYIASGLNQQWQNNIKVCPTCHKPGHNAKHCPHLAIKIQCSICHRFGHSSRGCPQTERTNYRT